VRPNAFAEQRCCSCVLGRRFHVSPRNPFRLIQHLGEDFAVAVQAFPSTSALTRPLAVQKWDRVAQAVDPDAQCAPINKLGASVKNNDFSKPPLSALPRGIGSIGNREKASLVKEW